MADDDGLGDFMAGMTDSATGTAAAAPETAPSPV